MVHFIIPLYNKSAILIDSLEKIQHYLKTHFKESYEIVLCDDGSQDDTLVKAGEYASDNPLIRIVGYKINRGRGYAIKFAGNSCNGDYMIYFDLDLPKTTELSRLTEMLNQLRENDIVIGSRFLTCSQITRIPLRNFISKVYRLLVRLIFPELKINDIDVGFKGFRALCFKEVNLCSKINRWAWDLEFLTVARAKGMKIKEFPIEWNEKHDGYSSAVNIFKDSLEELWGILTIRLRSLNKFRRS